MPVRIESNAEPIPGYRLIERLGGGGFGEVWKAEAPGGLFKAIKFVYGDLQTMDDGGRAEQELKALSRVKTVHHPFILSLERYDIIEGQLLIVMELADRTLFDRFKESRTQGLIGIPRVELLAYMEETAEALDLMNSQYQLQHLDIKPQNLFLVYNHVKVADFGLVKDLEGMAATVTGGVTPVYAAPETFDGWVSRYSDQYSLAIVYQELLTGQRPYTGTTMRQLVLQHLQGEPDLSSLPLADRPIIAKALSKNPDLRFPTCIEFVRALREVLQNAEAPATGPLGAVPTSDDPSTAIMRPAGAEPIEIPSQPLDLEQTCEARGRRRFPAVPRDNGASTGAAGSAATPATGETPAELPQPISSNSTQMRRKFAGTETGVLSPALVIGLGQLGLGALRQLRKVLYEQLGTPEALPHIRFLYIDTDADAVADATAGEAEKALRTHEVVTTRLHRPSHYLKVREGKPPVEAWLNPKVLYRIPRQQKHTGLRALGRLAFVDYHRTIQKRLEMELAACCSGDALGQAMQQTGLDFRSRLPRVYVVTSLAGGTGSGMFIDVAYAARHLLRKAGQPTAEVIGILLVPHVEEDSPRTPALVNTFTALTELNHFARSDAFFTARYETAENQPTKVFQEVGPAFRRCVIVSQGKKTPQNSGEPCAAALSRVGHYLFSELASPVARAVDEARRSRWSDNKTGDTAFQTFGLHRIYWPRRRLLHQAGQILCRRLVQYWMSKDARRVADEIRLWTGQQWEAHGLRLENLIAGHQEQAEKRLQQTPDKLFSQLLAPVLSQLTPPAGKAAPESLNLGPVVQLMDRLEKMIGVPDECRVPTVGTAPEAAQVEKILAEIGGTLAAEFEDKLGELIVRLIEEPAYRLAGAEEAIRQFSVLVEQALQSQETLAKELNERATGLYQRIHALLETPTPAPDKTSSSFWKVPFTRKATPGSLASEMIELVRSYPKARYQSLILQQITRLYVSLRGLLSDQLREIGFCRHRLTELLDLLRPSLSGGNVADPGDKCLLPAGCASVEESVKHIDDSVSAADLFTFDRQVQEVLRKQYRALVQVCMASSTVIKTLAPALMTEAQTFLQGKLEGTHVVDMYLARFPGEGEERAMAIRADLADAFHQATPELSPTTAVREIALVAVPPMAELQDHLMAAAPDTRLVQTDLADEILFFREDPDLSLSQLPHLSRAIREVYRQGASVDPGLLHSRIDITDWRTACAVS